MRVEVIAVATPTGLLRAINQSFWGNSCKEMVDHLVKAIGIFNLEDTEWTGDTYYMPSYLGNTMKRTEGGIFFYPWVTSQQKHRFDPNHVGDRYDRASEWNNPKQRWTLSSHRELLFRPNGWVG